MARLLMIFVLLLGSATASADDFQVRQKFATPFADARDAIVMGIESRGLVINYISHLGDMLQRTAADLGASKQIFAQAEIIEFCSARLSRQMMELDPHNVVLCPFAIAVYTLPEQPGVTWIAYRRPPPAVAALVEPLLAGLVAEAGQ